MDYKQKYKESLERAKEQLNGAKVFDYDNEQIAHDIRTTTYAIFPELKESEDERIRKELITHCRNTRCVTEEGAERIAKWVAWLEKQDNTNEIINRDEFAQGVLRGAAINLITWIDYNSAEGNMCLSNMECKDIEDALIHADWGRIYAYLKKKLEKQDEQKHKFNIGDIISNGQAVYRVGDITKNCIGQDCYFLVNVEYEKNGIQHLSLTDSEREHSNVGEITLLCEQVDKSFEKQGEQEPVELGHSEVTKKGDQELSNVVEEAKEAMYGNPAWSEEDEKKLLCICAWIKDYPRIADFKDEMYTVANNYIDWLKSLKYQNTWKPSETDILLLERIANGKSNPQDFQASLCGFIGQLKKLREE